VASNICQALPYDTANAGSANDATATATADAADDATAADGTAAVFRWSASEAPLPAWAAVAVALPPPIPTTLTTPWLPPIPSPNMLDRIDVDAGAAATRAPHAGSRMKGRRRTEMSYALIGCRGKRCGWAARHL